MCPNSGWLVLPSVRAQGSPLPRWGLWDERRGTLHPIPVPSPRGGRREGCETWVKVTLGAFSLISIAEPATETCVFWKPRNLCALFLPAAALKSGLEWIKINRPTKITTKCKTVELCPFHGACQEGGCCLDHRKFPIGQLCMADCPSL